MAKQKQVKPPEPVPGEALHAKLMEEAWMLQWKVRDAQREVERHRAALPSQPHWNKFGMVRTISRLEVEAQVLEREVARRWGEVARMGEALAARPSPQKRKNSKAVA
jgi:hypothetical protein